MSFCFSNLQNCDKVNKKRANFLSGIEIFLILVLKTQKMYRIISILIELLVLFKNRDKIFNFCNWYSKNKNFQKGW